MALEPWMMWGIAAGFIVGLVILGAWGLVGIKGRRSREGFDGGEAAKPTTIWDAEAAALACPYFESAWKTSEAALKVLKEGAPERESLEAFVAEYKAKCEQLGCPNTTREPVR